MVHEKHRAGGLNSHLDIFKACFKLPAHELKAH